VERINPNCSKKFFVHHCHLLSNVLDIKVLRRKSLEFFRLYLFIVSYFSLLNNGAVEKRIFHSFGLRKEEVKQRNRWVKHIE